MRVIVLEGINGAGKSCLGATLEQFLSASSEGLCVAADPTSFGLVGQVLREQLVHPSTVSSPDLDAVLFSALRAEGAGRMTQLAQGRADGVVLLERWSLALAAYGQVDGAKAELVAELRAVLDSLLRVDLTFLLDIDGLTAARRLEGLGRPNRFEARGPKYLEAVAQRYRVLATSDGSIALIDGSGSPIATFAAVRGVLASKWPDVYGAA